MRLHEREKRDVWLFAMNGMHDDVYEWGEAVRIRAAIYPAEQEIRRAVYGEGVKESRLLLYDGGEKLCAGMGVALDGGTPAFRIVKVERWGHARAVMERIAEGRRG